MQGELTVATLRELKGLKKKLDRMVKSRSTQKRLESVQILCELINNKKKWEICNILTRNESNFGYFWGSLFQKREETNLFDKVEEWLFYLVNDEDFSVRQSVAENLVYLPSKSLSKSLFVKLWTQLSEDDVVEVRQKLGENPSISQEIIVRLAQDKSEEVRQAVARNPKTPEDVLISLVKDKSEAVFCEVLQNPSISETVLWELLVRNEHRPSTLWVWYKLFFIGVMDEENEKKYSAIHEKITENLLLKLVKEPLCAQSPYSELFLNYICAKHEKISNSFFLDLVEHGPADLIKRLGERLAEENIAIPLEALESGLKRNCQVFQKLVCQQSTRQVLSGLLKSKLNSSSVHSEGEKI